MLPKKKSGSGPQPFNDRVRGAEESARELSARVEAFLAELARPPDPPPWSPPPDTGDEVERLRALLASSQRHALVAENRAEVAEEQLGALKAFCARLERSLADSEARAAKAEAALATVTAELLHLQAPSNDAPKGRDLVVRVAHVDSGANDSPQERRARQHLDDLLYPG